MARTFMIVVGLLAAGLFFFTRGGEVSGADARDLVDRGARLVDVRTPAEFAAGHIPGAVNIPVQVLERRMAELDPKDAPIVVYCRSGNRSASAKRMLEGAGFTDVLDLGAMINW